MTRLGLIGLTLLAVLMACSPLQNKYKVAASNLYFTLNQVKSNIELEFPVSKTKILFKLTLEVENPTKTTLTVSEFDGKLFLSTNESRLYMGKVKLLQTTKLPAKSKVKFTIMTTTSYKDLANGWTLINKALDKEIAGNWELSGTIRGNINNIPISLPVKSTQPL